MHQPQPDRQTETSDVAFRGSGLCGRVPFIAAAFTGGGRGAAMSRRIAASLTTAADSRSVGGESVLDS